ncbi:MAG: hypothetical protein RMM53_06485, partial [Bacteroidia bacterium]|nr:hypothetical protein [Bacteroidia bacterium]MDW8333844.1 hypothetical protein [Bacteroidia bacterium]
PSQFVNSGTNFRKALLMLLSRIEAEGLTDRALSVVVFTDGEFEQTDNFSLYKRLKATGARLIPVGVGTAGGGMVPGENGKPFLAPDGTPAVSRLVRETLEEIAKFFDSPAIFYDFPDSVAPIVAAVAQTPAYRTGGSNAQSENIYPFFLLAAVACLFAGYLAVPARKS